MRVCLARRVDLEDCSRQGTVSGWRFSINRPRAPARPPNVGPAAGSRQPAAASSFAGCALSGISCVTRRYWRKHRGCIIGPIQMPTCKCRHHSRLAQCGFYHVPHTATRTSSLVGCFSFGAVDRVLLRPVAVLVVSVRIPEGGRCGIARSVELASSFPGPGSTLTRDVGTEVASEHA